MIVAVVTRKRANSSECQTCNPAKHTSRRPPGPPEGDQLGHSLPLASNHRFQSPNARQYPFGNCGLEMDIGQPAEHVQYLSHL